MKYALLVAGGVSDEPLEALNGRTPLEVAKKPHWDALAKEGTLGSVLLTTKKLPASPEMAVFSLLGFDPEEFFTGVGPLEAPAFGISGSDREVVFRCDFVTADQECLVDAFAGHIRSEESRRLIEALDQKLSNPKLRFYPGEGYKNFLVCGDEELVHFFEDLVCENPEGLIGEKFSRHFPKGKEARTLTELMDRSRKLLGEHEINRVRIDLHENPANLIWLWGQGRRPKLPGFGQRHSLSGAVVSQEDFVKGLASALGMTVFGTLEEALDAADFVFLYKRFSTQEKAEKHWQSKVRFIEEFDAQTISEAVRLKKRFEDLRLCVSTDTGAASSKPMPFHAQVPFLLDHRRDGMLSAGFFSEKAAAQSALLVEPGHELLNTFLKGLD
jgi:2,3-bisphosphoglycerate-independent phosphoglycerate mutase